MSKKAPACFAKSSGYVFNHPRRETISKSLHSESDWTWTLLTASSATTVDNTIKMADTVQKHGCQWCIRSIDSARRDWSSARRDWRLFFQTFQPSFVISWPISTNEPSLESLKSQQNDGAIFCSRVAKGTNDSAVFKEGTHTFGSYSPNPYMQRPDQFVQGRDRGAKNWGM